MPVNHTNPLKASAPIAGPVETVDPFENMGFESLYGNNVATSASNSDNSLPCAAREGATLHYTAGQLMLFGGKHGAECKSNLYTPATG